MDVQMPEMDGFEATAAIGKGERAAGRHTPIIAMTAHALQGDKDGACQRAWTLTFQNLFRRMSFRDDREDCRKPVMRAGPSNVLETQGELAHWE